MEVDLRRPAGGVLARRTPPAMQPLTIFVVHPSDMLTDHLPNGAGWIVYNYLKGLTQRGHTVHVATPRLEMLGPAPPGMHVYVIPKSAAGNLFGRLSYIRAVRRLFTRLSARVSFDIAQQFTPVETGLSLALLGTGIPLVLGPYSGYWPADAEGPPQRAGIVSRCKRLMRNRLAALQQLPARALIVTCPAAIERIAWSGLHKDRVHVISHGIDSEAYPERGVFPNKPSILFLANLEYRKGIFTLLDAFDAVAAASPECTLEIWGDGAEAASVEQRALKSPYAHRIHRNGRAPRDRVAELMRSHSVYCMPSHGEPFGMTLLEAMASGVPVVTTDLGGPPYLVHEAGGRIVPVRDAARLADSLIEVLSRVALQMSMGAYNRDRIVREFDWRRSLDRMESVYRQVLSTNADPSAGHSPDTRWTSV